jgi:type I restriction enzyme M protein
VEPIALRTQLLAAVPEDGQAIGNQSLLEALRQQQPALSDDDFWAARDALIAEGILQKGRGRGGAVRRAQASEAQESKSTEIMGADTQGTPRNEHTADQAMTDTVTSPAAQPAQRGRKSKAPSDSTSTLIELEKMLWATADKLRANMDAAEYKHIVLGLIFRQVHLRTASLVVAPN